MSKEYDYIEWNFLEVLLIFFEFPNLRIKIIMECATIVSYFILINGVPSKPLRLRARIRQGDPLSPYMFILYMEMLLGMLSSASEQSLVMRI